MPDYTATHGPNALPGGIPHRTPAISVPDTESRGFVFSHRLEVLIVHNTGDQDLGLTYAKADTMKTPLPAGVALSLAGPSGLAIKEMHVHNDTGTGNPGTVAVWAVYGRDALASGDPALTVDNGFAAYSASDPDAIVPGVAAS